MRIGVNCFLLQAHIGGLKQYFITLFDWLLQNDRDNEYIFFHFPHNDGELAKLASDKWKRRSVLLSNQSEIGAHLKRLDVYFCPFSALWPRPVKLPSVMTLVDIQEVFYPQFFTRHDLYEREYHYPSSTRAADRVITISEFSKSTLVKHHGIAESKVIVAHLCADPAFFRTDQMKAATNGPVPFADFVFFPANRWHHKNHDVLFKAVQILKERGRRVNLVLTGFDVEGGFPAIQKAAEYNISDRVYSAGYVTVSEMAHLYARAEMLVFPSLFEGFGMPPVEAMAVGCPALVSNRTCVPEICGDAAEYFDPSDASGLADAIVRLRDDPTRRLQLIEKGRLRAGQFSAERMARAHLLAFEEAVGSYSVARYRWHQIAYQPYHRARVISKYAVDRWIDSRPKTRDCRVRFQRGWYSREETGAGWLRWTGKRGRLVVKAHSAMTVRVAGEIASIKSPNKVRIFANKTLVDTYLVEGDFGFRELPEITVRLNAGTNILEFVSMEPGIRSESRDSRVLAIAIRNLCVVDLRGETRCLVS
jgi:glycosyltransferase involved in cell wall biosynthesis